MGTKGSRGRNEQETSEGEGEGKGGLVGEGDTKGDQ